jgi:hypothetical protein
MEEDGAPLELEFEGEQDVPIVDGFLSENGLTFVFKGIVEGKGVLYWTKRESLVDQWGVATPLPGEVNTPDGDERDPWLSEDEKTLFFAREGDIYRAEWLPEETADGN